MPRFILSCRSCSCFRPCALHQVPPTVRHKSDHPPYTIRHGTPYFASSHISPRCNTDQHQPTVVRMHPQPAVAVTPRSLRWYDTLHTPQIAAVPTPSLQTESLQMQTIIHRDLANPRAVYPYLHWDISQLPSSSRQMEDACTSRLPSFNDRALDPGCNTVQINFNHPTFNYVLGCFGSIMVYPLSNNSDVTVEDIMNAIYAFFQQPLALHEWSAISVFEQQQILESYSKRISQTYRLPGYERIRGPLRVDMLKGCTCFAGLQTMSTLNRSALLHMDLIGSC